MRQITAACLLLSIVATGLLRGITARKPKMTPAGEELIIQEGGVLKIECQGEGRLQFSTQWNMARIDQSEFYISFNNDSDTYTFTRPNAIRADTGWYACAYREGIKILNDEQTIDHPDTDISWIYVYVNSSEPFAVDTRDRDFWAYIPRSSWSPRRLVIPCRPTSPALPVILAIDNTFPDENLQLPNDIPYDPKIGFIIDDATFKRLHYYRRFRCTINETERIPMRGEYFNSNAPVYVIWSDIGWFSRSGMPEILQHNLAHAVKGGNLRLKCRIDMPATGERMSLEWKPPASIPVERSSVNRVQEIEPDYRAVMNVNWETWNLELTIRNLKWSDGGEYSCVAKDPSTGATRSATTIVWISVPGRIETDRGRRVGLNAHTGLWCYLRGYLLSNFKWTKINESGHNINSMHRTKTFVTDQYSMLLVLIFNSIRREDNGTYECTADDYNGTISSRQDLTVIEVPEVNIDFAKAVGAGKVYLHWTVFDGNEPVTIHSIQRMKNGAERWEDSSQEISGENSSYFVKGLEKGTAYRFKITANNSIGISHPAYSEWITTLDVDPEFVTRISINGTSNTSITIGWTVLPAEHRDLVHYHKVRLTHGGNTTEATYRATESDCYTLKDLETGERYAITVAACSNYTERCGEWSGQKETDVIDRDPKFVTNVSLEESTLNSIKIRWSMPPMELQARVHQYKVLATNLKGRRGPFYVNGSENSYTFENLEPNTYYLLKVAACSEYETQCGNWSSEEKGLTVIADNGGQVTFWVVGSIFAILVVLFVAIWMNIRNRRELVARRTFMYVTMKLFKEGARDDVDPELDMAEQAELLPYNKKWEYPPNLLNLGKVLGSGAFGIVRKAEVKSMFKGQTDSSVAVKMVRATHRLDHMTALTRELKILAHLGKHLNIVNLLGACTKKISFGRLYVVVEFCRFGNLHDYLLRSRANFVEEIDIANRNIAGSSSKMVCRDANDRSMNTADSDDNSAIGECSQSTGSSGTSMIVEDPDSENNTVGPVGGMRYNGDFSDSDLEPIGVRDLLCWVWQVSRGMNYLSSKKVLHGDLAARNILLADNNVVKICDFGLAKSLYAGDIYKKSGNGPLPVKWMAIESIRDRVFSVKSDVWSFGVVLWELFTLAETPYPGVTNERVYEKLLDGFRMEQPKYATEAIYRVMLSCWDAEPSNRPSFRELEEILDDLLDERVDKGHYLDFDAIYEKINADELAGGKKDYLTMNASEYASNIAETTV